MTGARYQPVTAKGLATQARIVAATKVIYQRHGRDNLTTELVAEEAHVAIGTVYRYFQHRVDLLDAAYPNRDREALDRFIERLKGLDVTKVWESDDYLPVERIDLDDINQLIEEFAS